MTQRGVLTALLILVVGALAVRGGTFSESFSTDPRARGWSSFGDSSLFAWNPTNQNLEVTWNSSRTNSYFWLPLRTIVGRGDDFSVSFDLRLGDITIGTSSNKPYTFQIALGFLNFSNATATNFYRGAGQSAVGPRNLVEFNYFPDSGFGATVAPTVVSTSNRIYFSDNHPLVMATGDLFHITMSYAATNRTLKTAITRNGTTFSTIKDLAIGASGADFRCDALAVMSYSDAIQVGSTQFWGSVLAHGIVDNVVLTVPDPPLQFLSGAKSNTTWRAQFQSRTNWNYALERSTNLVAWTVVSPTNSGVGGTMELLDSNATSAAAFYRVNALKP